ncbi:MAG TPA: hypothetical protein DD491_15880, partial [Halieaceae bacterium]|nr:hypothetical protein [Halieaceae bacterium]
MPRRLALFALLLANVVGAEAPPPEAERGSMPAAVQAQPALDGAAIIARAHAAAGGEHFVKPGTLFLAGYNIIRPPGGGEVLWDRYA